MTINKSTLIKLRKDKKLSRWEMSLEINISQATITALESGVRDCSLYTAKKLADFFGVKIDDLL